MKRHTYSLSLNEQEESQYQDVKRTTGYGVKKIFMATVKALAPVETLPLRIVNEVLDIEE